MQQKKRSQDTTVAAADVTVQSWSIRERILLKAAGQQEPLTVSSRGQQPISADAVI
jgi:hypothetical protein